MCYRDVRYYDLYLSRCILYISMFERSTKVSLFSLLFFVLVADVLFQLLMSPAPLSGPLVIAETLGVPKSSKTPTKVKDSKKQDKYLLKRRDEAGDKTLPFGQAEASSSTGDSALRRRASTLQSPMKDEQPGIVSMDVNSSSAAIPGKESSVPKLSLDEEKDAAEESA